MGHISKNGSYSVANKRKLNYICLRLRHAYHKNGCFDDMLNGSRQKRRDAFTKIMFLLDK